MTLTSKCSRKRVVLVPSRGRHHHVLTIKTGPRIWVAAAEENPAAAVRPAFGEHSDESFLAQRPATTT